MKSLLTISLLLLTSVSFAELKPQGTFVPSACSALQKNDVGAGQVSILQVCIGEYAGMQQQGILLRTSDGENRTFAVSGIKDSGQMGVTTSKFSGSRFPQRINETITGSYAYSTGMTVSRQIKLTTSSHLSFEGNLEPVFNTL